MTPGWNEGLFMHTCVILSFRFRDTPLQIFELAGSRTTSSLHAQVLNPGPADYAASGPYEYTHSKPSNTLRPAGPSAKKSAAAMYRRAVADRECAARRLVTLTAPREGE
jgi:hypothetical protein